MFQSGQGLSGLSADSINQAIREQITLTMLFSRFYFFIVSATPKAAFF